MTIHIKDLCYHCNIQGISSRGHRMDLKLNESYGSGKLSIKYKKELFKIINKKLWK